MSSLGTPRFARGERREGAMNLPAMETPPNRAMKPADATAALLLLLAGGSPGALAPMGTPTA